MEPLTPSQPETPAKVPLPPHTPPTMNIMANAGSLSQMLERNLELSEENNRILKNMRFMDTVGFWVKLIFWALVLGLPVIFFQPIVEYIKGTVMENPSAFGIPSTAELQKAFGEFRGESVP